ncbi:MAG: flagellar biosynthetic protein FliO [candidate division Zixibacteria bacterium]|nr:flagellar biosynthetic protein FliO [candidate division Zixibacteria bacterium]
MNKILKNRSVIGTTLIVAVALIGLIFVKTDYVSADRVSLQTSQSLDNVYSPLSGESTSGLSVLPSLVRIISALVIVVVCIYVGIFLLKKLMSKRNGRRTINGNLEIIETIHIAPRKSVTLIRVGEKSILVGTTEGSMSLLCEQDEIETGKLLVETVSEAPALGFGEMLSTAVAKVKEVARKGKKTAVFSKLS